MKIIAELGDCNGDFNYAVHSAARAAQAGAWAVKVQMYRRERLVSEWAERYDRTGGGGTQFELMGTQLPYTSWGKIKQICDDLGVEFFASCWDEDAVDACEEMGVNFYKVGSADITHQPLIEKVAATGKGVFMSTGASYMEEVEQAVGWVVGASPTEAVHLVLLACTLSYPADKFNAGVGRMAALSGRFPQVPVGYSDHTTTLHAAWVAAALGASFLERHFTVTPGAGGDHNFAANFETLKQLVDIGNEVPGVRGKYPPELFPMPSELAARERARRSIVARTDIAKGTRLTADLLDYRRPGIGLPPTQAAVLLGEDGKKAMVAMVDIPEGTQLRKEWAGYAGGTLTVE